MAKKRKWPEGQLSLFDCFEEELREEKERKATTLDNDILATVKKYSVAWDNLTALSNDEQLRVIHGMIQQQIENIGRGEEYAKGYASLFVSHVNVRAQQLGIAPQEYLSVYANLSYEVIEEAQKAQKNSDDNRGYISFPKLYGESEEITIGISLNVNATKPVQEASKFYLWEIAQLAKKFPENKQIQEDFEVIKEALGWQIGQENFTNEQYEKFADMQICK